MKKFLLFLFLLNGILFSQRSTGQCDLSFPNIARAFSTDITSLGPNKCQYTISLSFEIVTNSGFKHLYFHSWLLQDYPSPPIFHCNGRTPAVDPGTSEQLGTAVDDPGKSFNDLGFNGLNDIVFPANTAVDVTANISTEYPHDASVVLTSPLNSPGMTATITRMGNSDTLRFDITNMRIILNTPCSAPVIIVTDIWGSNSSARDPKAQCYVCGIGESFGEPTIALRKLCTARPFQFEIGLTTQSTVDLHVVYRVYADDLDGIPEPNGDDSLVFVSDTVIINSTTPYNSGAINLPPPFCCTDPWAQWGLFAEVTAREFSNVISSTVIEEACATLPVTLRSFTAARNNSTVLLKWETASEQHNKGFNIQRNIGSGWQDLAFVETKAINGNSSSLLSYNYSDLNNAKGVTQYRLQQIDIGGKLSYSQIRSVRANGQKGKTIIYPNPTDDGKINVVFPDVNLTRDVTLSDLYGRTVKQWKGITNNNLQIDNLSAGFYTIRIIEVDTGEQTVEKIVVKKR